MPGHDGVCSHSDQNQNGLSLPVLNQNPVAAPADMGAVVLEAGQYRLITIIHDGPAVPHHVAGAGIVLALGRLRGRRRRKNNGSKGNKRKERNKPDHHFSPQNASPMGTRFSALQASTHAIPDGSAAAAKIQAALGGR